MDQEEQELRERKTDALVNLVSRKSEEVSASREALHTFLKFFARIANRWSAANALAIYGQRPDIKYPVTIEQAKKLGHSIKPGTTAISILEPTAIDEKIARQNSYLMFRKWALSRGLTEQDLRQLCLQHVQQSLQHDQAGSYLDLHSPKASFGLRQRVFEAYPDWDRPHANQLYNYARQYLSNEGAFDPQEIQRGQSLYHWKAKTSVVDLGVDTHGPKIQPEVGDQELVTNRSCAALLRFIESRDLRVDYKQLEGLSPEVKLDRLIKSAVGFIALERRQKINVNAAAFCVYSQLGINRKFDISTLDGWGTKPGEFMANLSAIRKIQKEVTTGMDREMQTIVMLELELARTERQATKLRDQLNQLGIRTAAAASVAQPVVAPATTDKAREPIIKNAQASPGRVTPDQLDHRGLYFKVGRLSFLTHNEAAEFLVGSRFVDGVGKELKVQIKRRSETGSKKTICEMSASSFVQELINTQSEPQMVRAADSAIAADALEQTIPTKQSAFESVAIEESTHNQEEQEHRIGV